MSADKLRNLAKMPGMSDLVGSLGVELINDIADSYSDMYEALKELIEIIRPCTVDGDFGDIDSFTLQPADKALAKAKGE